MIGALLIFSSALISLWIWFMRRQSSNQALQLTPFDCRSGQANWAATMTKFDFMKQFSKFTTLVAASGGSACSR